jgi:transcriptional regulator, CopG family
MPREIEIERCIKTSDGEEVCFPLSVVVESGRGEVPVESEKPSEKPKETKDRKRKEPMELVSVHLPRAMLIALDNMVRRGIYPNRSEAIRDALAKLLAQYKDVLRGEGR